MSPELPFRNPPPHITGKVIQMSDFLAFIDSKTHSRNNFGFAPIIDFPQLFDFQRALVDWSLRLGRAAIYADCGLGKTFIQLAWAQNVVERTNRPVLVVTPLAVSYQTIREAEKLGVQAQRSQDGAAPPQPCVVVTNYQRLERFNPVDFAGLVCDESSILKSFDGVLRGLITAFMLKMPYRLLCTATAAPNDYTELGTSSEALGYLGNMDMLNRFFKNDQNTTDIGSPWRAHHGGQRWRFKGHAEIPFWRWVCSWARSLRKPSDLGFENGGFELPPLKEIPCWIESNSLPAGHLFAKPAEGLQEQREERRRTIAERCDALAEKVCNQDRSLVWCQLNDEGDRLEKLIPDCVQIKGADSDDVKEETFRAFADGTLKRLVTKSSIAGWGLNFQSCNHIATFPSHSYEQYYQGVRRCWRFGQQNPVTVDMICTEGDRSVLENLKRKSEAADRMFSNLVVEMRRAQTVNNNSGFTQKERIPSWL